MKESYINNTVENKPARYMVIDQSGDVFHGTPEQIVCDFSRWDTSMGRCKNNQNYMKLVTTRLSGLPICSSEIDFLHKLEELGMVEIHEEN